MSVPERRTGAGGLRGALTRQQTAASQPALHTYLATYAATRLHHNRSTAPAPAAASGPGAGPGMRRRVGGRHDWPTRKAQRPGDWATRWDRERKGSSLALAIAGAVVGWPEGSTERVSLAVFWLFFVRFALLLACSESILA